MLAVAADLLVLSKSQFCWPKSLAPLSPATL